MTIGLFGSLFQKYHVIFQPIQVKLTQDSLETCESLFTQIQALQYAHSHLAPKIGK